MIKLKNGFEVAYDSDIDVFVNNLARALVRESLKSAAVSAADAPDGNGEDAVLREVMDNCIFVTHQIFELGRQNEKLSKFLISAFLFNYSVVLFKRLEGGGPSGRQGGGTPPLH
jgi:hypothetical protein